MNNVRYECSNGMNKRNSVNKSDSSGDETAKQR
jgi:hypothetical protein